MGISERLSPQDWIDAGFVALASEGADGLRAEVLARRLGTTKGSFYWHFKDVPTYQGALLGIWEDVSRASMEAALHLPDPARRLRVLLQFIAAPPGDAGAVVAAEPAIWSWATTSPAAAQSLARIDAKRSTAIKGQLRALGIGNPDFARICQATATGLRSSPTTDTADAISAIGSLVDLMVSLQR